MDVALIKQQVAHTRTENIKDTKVMEALKNLNKGKAADLDGIRAEHLQAVSDHWYLCNRMVANSVTLIWIE